MPERRKIPIPHTVKWLITLLLWCAVDAASGTAQDAILPQGDPRLRETETERAHREAVRDSRLRQQGQGSNYRVDGEPQPPSDRTTSAPSDSNGRQNTGIADPSVNPGQASGMQHVQGRVVTSDAGHLVVHQRSGIDTMLFVDSDTTGETNLQPGDVITGTVTAQGRVVTIEKERRPSPDR